MDRVRGFSVAVIVLEGLVWLIAANIWLTGENATDPVRGCTLAAIALFSTGVLLFKNPWPTRTRRRRRRLETDWVGESLAVTVGILWVAAAPIHPELGVVITVITWLACRGVLRQKSRRTRPSQA